MVNSEVTQYSRETLNAPEVIDYEPGQVLVFDARGGKWKITKCEAERNRFKTLIAAGKASGKLDYAFECIEKGLSIHDDVVQATFLTAKINKNALDTRKSNKKERKWQILK